MSIKVYKFALGAADIPFISTQQPRSVVVGELDSAGRLPRDFYGAQPSYDYNTLQVVYAENVMPTAFGWSFVDYTTAITGPSTSYWDATDAPYLPTAGAGKLQYLIKSDPNGFELVDHLPALLPTSTENLLMLTAKDPSSAASRLWIRYPLTNTDPYARWAQFKYFDNTATIQKLSMSGDLGPGPVTLASPAGIQLMCIPGDGLFFIGTTQSAGSIPGPGASLVFMGVRQYCYGTIPTLSPSVEPSQFIKNFPGDTTKLTCIIASNGYLVAAYDNVVAWALASGNVFDFAPIANTAVTGSDSRVPEELKGNITAMVPIAGGFLIFSARNCVAAFYSSTNFANPWTFRQLSGAGGVNTNANIASDDNNGAVYAITSAGFQKLTLTSAVDVSPVCSDFLTGRELELYNQETKMLEKYSLSSDLDTQCALVGNRYVCISVGFDLATYYDIALIYDLQLKRWGKLHRRHKQVCSIFGADASVDLAVDDLGDSEVLDYEEVPIDTLVSSTTGQYRDYRHQIAMLDDSCSLLQVSVAPSDNTNLGYLGGVIVFGQLQLSRTRYTECHAIEVEGALTASVDLYPSYDGRNLELPYNSDNWMQVESTGDYAKWAGFCTALNFNFSITGSFKLSTMLVKVAAEGLV